MRHPKFVSKEFLEWDEHELGTLGDMLGQIFQYDEVSCKTETKPCYTVIFTVKLKNPPKKIYATDELRIEHLSELQFFFWKQTGQDSPDTPVYMQYSVSMGTNGVEHRLWSRHTHDSFLWEGRCHYSYDDCLDEFYLDIMYWLIINRILDTEKLDHNHMCDLKELYEQKRRL